METWDLWYPDAGATGLPFARGRLDPADVLWVHPAPPNLSVTVRDDEERVVASGERLQRAGTRFPLTRLTRRGKAIEREDRWPASIDLGALVIMPAARSAA